MHSQVEILKINNSGDLMLSSRLFPGGNLHELYQSFDIERFNVIVGARLADAVMRTNAELSATPAAVPRLRRFHDGLFCLEDFHGLIRETFCSGLDVVTRANKMPRMTASLIGPCCQH